MHAPMEERIEADIQEEHPSLLTPNPTKCVGDNLGSYSRANGYHQDTQSAAMWTDNRPPRFHPRCDWEKNFWNSPHSRFDAEKRTGLSSVLRERIHREVSPPSCEPMSQSGQWAL